jgi:hypothetical protein
MAVELHAERSRRSHLPPVRDYASAERSIIDKSIRRAAVPSAVRKH